MRTLVAPVLPVMNAILLLVWVMLDCAQCLFLTLHSGITPSEAQGNICGVGNQIGISYVQDKCLNPCIISLWMSLVFLFWPFQWISSPKLCRLPKYFLTKKCVPFYVLIPWSIFKPVFMFWLNWRSFSFHPLTIECLFIQFSSSSFPEAPARF